jgi:hypothetical protein
MLPIATSMNTGASASWMVWAIKWPAFRDKLPAGMPQRAHHVKRGKSGAKTGTFFNFLLCCLTALRSAGFPATASRRTVVSVPRANPHICR